MNTLWRITVIVHIMIIIVIGVSMLIIPFVTHPVIAFILWVLFIRFCFIESPCPVTLIENALRSRIGKPQIDGFISHYFMRKIDWIGVFMWLKDVIKGW